MDKEPVSYPSRHHYPLNPGVPDRQLWAIGMVVVQWGMTEFLREQIIFSLIDDDATLKDEYAKLRYSNVRTEFWKKLANSKIKDEKKRLEHLSFIQRFETLNNQRDDIIHRLWGGGMQPGTLGAPDQVPTTDAALHRHRDERMKTKSTDARRNIRWRLNFLNLRGVARNMAQLNADIFASFLPPGTVPGIHDVWAYLTPTGKLEAGVASRSTEGDEESRD